MCGIGGFLALNSEVNIQDSWLLHISEQQKHRGPNAQHYYIHPQKKVGLCHQRLSILDLSEAGNQPMHYRGYSLIFNGEIYNYLELKSELFQLGHTFHTETDSEVLLVAYAQWGESCIEKLNGMWAFVIWDENNELLFCSRDRFGIKPLYYTTQQDTFAFASEITALSTWEKSHLSLNEEAINTYLWQGLYDLGEGTFYQEIHQLPPAHNLIIQAKTGILKKYRYWSLPETNNISTYAPDEFRHILEDSVRRQLQSDVPVGTCLSGGLDSSSITCLIQEIQSNTEKSWPLSTFSACFDDLRFDERNYIQKIIETTHPTAHFVFPDPDTLQKDLQSLISHQGEPFGSLSIFAQWCVMRKANEQGIKVLLDGQGADELLAGYGYDSLLWRDLFASRQWYVLRTELLAALHKGPIHLIKRLLSSLRWPKAISEPYFFRTVLTMAPPTKKYSAKKNGELRHQLKELLTTRLPALLRHEDRNSMAFSIEARVPFLDHRLAEFLWQQPLHALIYKGWSKWILRSAMQDILPPEICWRTDKMGFVTPQTIWAQNEMSIFYKTVIESPSFQSRRWWRAKQVKKVYQKFLKYPNDNMSNFLWRLINLELWLRQAQIPR